jgi:GntR family transcriptional regulator
MLSLDPSDPTPIYAQLGRAIRADIAAGRLKIGDRLPTVRQLAADLGINANTVARVYSELERHGVLATQRGVGTFIREPAEGHTPTPTDRDRERTLRQLCDRLLGDAHSFGITIDDVIRHLESRRTIDGGVER